MNRLRFLTSEVVLGLLIAVFSIMTAVASYQGALSDGDQSKANLAGMTALTDDNAEYLTANQVIIQDYTYFDTYYLNVDTNPEIAEYYQASFSDALNSSMERESGPFDEAYYEEMYAGPNEYFEDADGKFALGEKYNERGDQLQLVMMIMAVGLSFVAWASLLPAESRMRLVFTILALITLVLGFITYLRVPVVAG